MPTRRACVVTRLTRERARDHSGDGEVADQQFAGDPAGRVQLFDRRRLFVGGDLEHRVGRRVHDPIAGLLVPFSQPLDDLGAGGGLVADHSPPGGLGKAVEQLGGEAVGESGERLLGDDSHHLPVAGGGIHSAAALCQTAVHRRGIPAWRTAPHGQDVAKAKRCQRGQFETADRIGDMLQGAGTGGAELRRVGQVAGTHRIQHQYTCSGHAISLDHDR